MQRSLDKELGHKSGFDNVKSLDWSVSKAATYVLEANLSNGSVGGLTYYNFLFPAAMKCHIPYPLTLPQTPPPTPFAPSPKKRGQKRSILCLFENSAFLQ